MLGKTKHQTPIRLVKGVFVPSTQPFFPRTSWPRRVRTVWPQWLYQPWPQLWISSSSLIGPVSVQSTVLLIGTGSQTEQ